MLFFVFNGVGLLVQLAFVATARYGFGLKGTFSYNVANILGVTVATLFRLYTYRQWVFPMAGGEPLEAEHLQPETSGT
jgi:putative flippase GtrA